MIAQTNMDVPISATPVVHTQGKVSYNRWITGWTDAWINAWIDAWMD